MQNLLVATDKLKNQLMDVEVQLSDELDGHYNEYDNAISKFINNKIEPVITSG